MWVGYLLVYSTHKPSPPFLGEPFDSDYSKPKFGSPPLKRQRDEVPFFFLFRRDVSCCLFLLGQDVALSRMASKRRLSRAASSKMARITSECRPFCTMIGQSDLAALNRVPFFSVEYSRSHSEQFLGLDTVRAA